MKLIHVCGEDDHSVIDFLNLSISYKEAYDKAFHSEASIWNFQPNSWVTAIEFPKVKVTKEFMDFIQSVLKSESTDGEDFFIVEY